jgi:hypothetical protein
VRPTRRTGKRIREGDAEGACLSNSSCTDRRAPIPAAAPERAYSRDIGRRAKRAWMASKNRPCCRPPRVVYTGGSHRCGVGPLACVSLGEPVRTMSPGLTYSRRGIPSGWSRAVPLAERRLAYRRQSSREPRHLPGARPVSCSSARTLRGLAAVARTPSAEDSALEQSRV